jgi:hypothetical protein
MRGTFQVTFAEIRNLVIKDTFSFWKKLEGHLETVKMATSFK